MKKSLWGILIVLILVIVILGIYANGPKKDEVIRIGVIESLTGNAAYYGEENRKGVDIAAEEIRSKYPDFKFEVYHEDSQYSAKGGVDAYKKLREINNIDAVVTHASAPSLSVLPLAKNDNILQMAASASASDYSTPGDLSFRVSPKTDIEAISIVNFIKDKGYQKISIIYMENEIGKSIAESVKKGLEEKSIKIDIYEGFELTETDFKSLLLKIKEEKSDAVFAAGIASNTVLIIKQAKEMNIPAQFIGFRGAEDPILLQSGNFTEGFLYSYAFDPYSNNSKVKELVDPYKKKYNQEPNGYTAEGYEAFKITALGFIKCKKDYNCIKNYIENLKDYNSVFGPLSFDSNGDVSYDFFIKTVKEGKFVRYNLGD